MRRVTAFENFFLWVFLFFLTLFPILYGGTSPLGYSLILQSVFILSLVFFLRKPRVSLSLLILWLFYLATQVLSVFFTISPSRSFKALMLNFPYFFYFLLSITIFSKRNFKFLIYALVLNALILSMLSFYYLLPQVKKPETTLNLVYATYGHSHLADFLLLALPISLVFYLQKRKPLLFLLFLFFFVSFLLSFSRGAFLVLPFSLAFLFLHKKRGLILIALIPLLWLSGIFLTSKVHQLPPGKAPAGWFERQVIKRFEFKRLEYFRQSLVIFKKHPITGSGLGTFYLGSLRYQKTPFSWSWYTHNHFLQTLAETGILGILSFSFLLFFLLYKNYQIIKKEQNLYLTALYTGILASTFHSFIDFDWQFPAIFLWFLVLNGAILSFTPQKPRLRKLKLPLLTVAFGCFLIGLVFLISGNPVKSDPCNPEIYQDLAEKYTQEGSIEKALKNYQIAIKYNPIDSPSLYLKQTNLIFNPQDKIKILEGYYQLTNKYTWKDFGDKTKEISRLYFALAELYFNAQKFEKAEKILLKTLTEVDNWELDYYALLKKVFEAEGREAAYLPYAKMCQQQLPGEAKCN